MGIVRDRLAVFSERHFFLYAGAAWLRHLMQGPEPLPHLPVCEGRDDYLRDFAKWQPLRMRMLAKDEARLHRFTLANMGHVVSHGPFAGMSFRGCEEAFSTAMLLGFYEMELHPHIEAAVARPYAQIVNVGCAGGYYAVGLALRMPLATIRAFDMNAAAARACKALATENRVGDRVHVGGLFSGGDFDRLITGQTLVVCDIEGAEREVLDPDRYPSLRTADLIVELHDHISAGVSSAVVERFSKSHDVTVVREGEHPNPVIPPWIEALGSTERFAACYGGLRRGGAHWAIMRSLR